MKLIFDKNILALVGRTFGQKIYQEQIAPTHATHLEFPDHIEVINSSFAQGLLQKDLEEHGLVWTKEKYKISPQRLAQQFWNSLE